MTESQKSMCQQIIQSAEFTAQTIESSFITWSDIIEPITAVQAGMILGLANVFGITVTDVEAAQTAKTFMVGNQGKMIAGKITKILLPPMGNVVCGAVAGAITQSLGWETANEFAMKAKQKAC